MRKEYIIKTLTNSKKTIDDALAALKKNDTKSFEFHLQMLRHEIKGAENMHALDKIQGIGM